MPIVQGVVLMQVVEGKLQDGLEAGPLDTISELAERDEQALRLYLRHLSSSHLATQSLMIRLGLRIPLQAKAREHER